MPKSQQTDTHDAFALFPDLLQNIQGSGQGKKQKKAPSPSVEKSWKAQPHIHPKKRVLPPPPPDLSWLEHEHTAGQEKVEDIPMALVLMEKKGGDDILSEDLQELGYAVERVDSPAQALAKLSFTNFAAVVMQVGFGQESLAESAVHRYLTWLPPSKRRTMFYILVGPDFRTLYDLEALALSVNLVVNEADIECLPSIVRKSFREHEELFGPLVEALDGYGRKS